MGMYRVSVNIVGVIWL